MTLLLQLRSCSISKSTVSKSGVLCRYGRITSICLSYTSWKTLFKRRANFAVVSVSNCAWLFQKNTYHRFFDGRYSISKTGRKVKLSTVFNNLWNARECEQPIKRSLFFEPYPLWNIIRYYRIYEKRDGIDRLLPRYGYKSPFAFFVFKVSADNKRVQRLAKTNAEDV